MAHTAVYPSHRTRAFTLVEILIVVVILGILAAIVVPQFTSAAASTRDSSVKTDLVEIRSQLEIYVQEHGGIPPTLANITSQLTMASDTFGNTAAPGTPGYKYGPYLRDIPINPNTSSATIGNGAVGTSAWYYDETKIIFKANDSDASSQF